uniref:ATPase subunit 8 n=1 Tax=Malcus auriculatus TaxID=696230 RepID=UPI002008ECE3|nr:ATPase subunit 8 [Malcus auriculatus]UPI55341.1 ATPase subunit 8 [Malcus auriculatus]
MPQMSPMWWDYMYMYFIIIFMLTNMINYWINNKIMKKYNSKNTKNMNWPW